MSIPNEAEYEEIKASVKPLSLEGTLCGYKTIVRKYLDWHLKCHLQCHICSKKFFEKESFPNYDRFSCHCLVAQ